MKSRGQVLVEEACRSGIPIDMTVVHKGEGQVTVKAFCAWDAIMQAFVLWDMPLNRDDVKVHVTQLWRGKNAN